MTNEELVKLIQNGADKKHFLEQLYSQNKGFIAQIAKRYCGYAEIDDLMQEGFIGLCSACENWDECRGANFLTHASYYILSNISRYAKGQNILGIPENRFEVIYKYEKLVNAYMMNTCKKPSDRYLMLHLGISKRQLDQLKKDVEMLKTKSLDEPISVEDDSLSLGDSVRDPVDQSEIIENNIYNEQLGHTLGGIVDGLEHDQRAVIREKYWNNTDTKTLANKMDKTLGEVRTIEARAFRELRKHHNTKKLMPFFYSDYEYYSLGLSGVGLSSFNQTWTSAQERAVLMAEHTE